MFVSTNDLNHATLFYGRLVRALKSLFYEDSELATTDARKNAAGIKTAWIDNRVVKV